MNATTGLARWTEEYEGGSAQAEQKVFARLAQDVAALQYRLAKKAGQSSPKRTFHAKPVFCSADAELKFTDDLPAQFRHGFARPGAASPALVRLSNANGVGQDDAKPDMRGLAVRVLVDDTTSHDLLASSYPISHARNARQFVAVGKLAASGMVGRLFGIVGLALRFGPGDVVRMMSNLSKSRRPSASLALETYWSRGAMRWGPTLAVRYRFTPAAGTPAAMATRKDGPDFLTRDLERRLNQGDVTFDLWLQPFVDATATPIENAAKLWSETASPPVKVATLTIRKPPANAAEAASHGRSVEDAAFNPWNTTDEFRPLGNINRARKDAYDASAAHRLALSWHTPVWWLNRIAQRAAVAVFGAVNQVIEWHRIPFQHVRLANLDAFRIQLRRDNLIDTEVAETPPRARPVPTAPAEDDRRMRRADGRFTDLSSGPMGAAGAAFGRNIAPKFQPELFDTPDPYRVSRELLARNQFIPAASLNILAAAWIQFQVHDWVNHMRHPLGVDDVRVKLPPGMTWKNSADGPEETVMRIGGNTFPVERTEGRPPIYFRNTETHWWDASDIYGSSHGVARDVRDGPRLRLPGGYLPVGADGSELSGFHQSWWLGLSAMQVLFAREHNLLCDELRIHYSNWSDERIYQTARLIVCALIAKIHTVEWTPALLSTRDLEIAMNTNWYGAPKDRWLRAGLWLLDKNTIPGIRKTMPDHNGVPYSLTEDFVTTYRMHPLIPDDYCLFDSGTGAKIGERTFMDIQGANTDDEMRAHGLANVLYSFGIANPGAITLHNFPRSLMKLQRVGEPGGEIIDLSIVDLVRTRRRGVPRYNDFRAGLHRPRIRRWEDLAADPEDVRLLKDIYKDIDLVDTVVGLLAETPPTGFGFSDTAFRIFILMASRRIQSDRFLTVDYRPEVYSPFGLDWIEKNGMKSLIQRHCPELATLMPSGPNVFVPWRQVASPQRPT